MAGSHQVILAFFTHWSLPSDPSPLPLGDPRHLATQQEAVIEGVQLIRVLSMGEEQMAVGQHKWDHFGVGAPPILIYFSGWIGMFTKGTGV